MIRRVVVTAVLVTAGLAFSSTAHAEPGPVGPAGNSPGILSGIVIQIPVNIPVIACLTAIIGLSDGKDDPDDYCLHLPDQTK